MAAAAYAKNVLKVIFGITKPAIEMPGYINPLIEILPITWVAR